MNENIILVSVLNIEILPRPQNIFANDLVCPEKNDLHRSSSFVKALNHFQQYNFSGAFILLKQSLIHINTMTIKLRQIAVCM
jgi:TnpA family transposase